MHRLLGFLPQAGIVDLSRPVRVLAEPVSQTRDGITVTVAAAISSADKTVVSFTVDNVPWSAISHDEQVGGCAGSAVLRLKDDRILEPVTGEGSYNLTTFIYPPIPPEMNEAVLVMPCIRETLPGKAPQNWELPIDFVLAPEVTTAPVIDLPAPTPSALPTPAATPSAASEPALFGIQLVIDRYIPIEDGYYLIGHTAWPDDRLAVAKTTRGMNWSLKAYDATGQELPFEPEMGMQTWFQLGITDPTPDQWVYHLFGKHFNGPVTLRTASMEVDLAQPVAFEWDPANDDIRPEDLRPDAAWQITPISIDVLDTRAFVTGVRYQEVGSMKGFEFQLRAEPPLRTLFLQINSHLAGGGGGGTRLGEQPGEFFATVLSDQPITFPLKVTASFGSIKGIWEVTWTPPASDSAGEPESQLSPCLNLEGWRAALQDPAPLPAGLPGQVLIERGAMAPDPTLFLAELDGSAERGLAFGHGSLTADGRKLVFSGSDNQLFVLDLTTNQLVSLNAGAQIYRPFWSPDGRLIAFSGYGDQAGIYVMNADGSNLHPVVRTEPGTNSPELSGWTADNMHLVYSVWSPINGTNTYRFANIGGGVPRDLLVTRQLGLAQVSPDGEWLAYQDHVPGKITPGLFVSHLDGTQRRLLVQLDEWPLGSPVWSPDGQWLAFPVLNDWMTGKSTNALLNVQTCQVAPIPSLNGAILSWVLP